MIFARGYCVRVGGGDGFLDDACLQWFKSQAMSSKISSRNIREKALHGGGSNLVIFTFCQLRHQKSKFSKFQQIISTICKAMRKI